VILKALSWIASGFQPCLHLLSRAGVSLVAFSRIVNRVFTSGEGRDLVLVTVAFTIWNREFRGRVGKRRFQVVRLRR